MNKCENMELPKDEISCSNENNGGRINNIKIIYEKVYMNEDVFGHVLYRGSNYVHVKYTGSNRYMKGQLFTLGITGKS